MTQAAALPKDAERAVRQAFSDLLEHLAYEREVAPKDDLTVPVDEITAWLDDEVADALGAGPLLVLDLHGQRAAAAKERLRSVHEPLAAVYFGKGTGVLRDVFHEVFSSTDDYLLVGLSGETDDRPQPSLGLLVRADAHARLLDALGGPKSRGAGAPVAAGFQPAAKKPPAPKKPRKKKEPPSRGAGVPAGPSANPAAWLVLGAVALGLAFLFPWILVVYLAVGIWYFEGRRR